MDRRAWRVTVHGVKKQEDNQVLLDFEFSLYRLYKVFPYVDIELSDSDFC